MSQAIAAHTAGMDFADALHLQCAQNAACDEGFASFDTRFIKRACQSNGPAASVVFDS